MGIKLNLDAAVFAKFTAAASPISPVSPGLLYQSIEQIRTVGTAASVTPPIVRDPVLAERDAWIHAQFVAGVKLKEILRRLQAEILRRVNVGERKWPKISTIQGIRDAANTHAKAIGSSPIPLRKRGRPPQS